MKNEFTLQIENQFPHTFNELKLFAIKNKSNFEELNSLELNKFLTLFFESEGIDVENIEKEMINYFVQMEHLITHFS